MTTTKTDGRTFREACEAGDYFILEATDGTKRHYDMPGCRGLAETLKGARKNGARQGETLNAKRVLPESRIGAMWVEDAGMVTVS